MRTRYSNALMAAVITLGAAACGDVTVGPGLGEVRIVAIGDGLAPDPGVAPGTVAPRGSISFTAEVSLLDETNERVALTPAPVTGTVRIESTDAATFIFRQVPTGRYSTLRLVFSNVSANVESGLVVNGVPFLGPLTVPAGASGIVVEVPVNLEVEAAFSSTLLLDLRATTWLAALEILSRTVPASAFSSAVDVRLQ